MWWNMVWGGVSERMIDEFMKHMTIIMTISEKRANR